MGAITESETKYVRKREGYDMIADDPSKFKVLLLYRIAGKEQRFWCASSGAKRAMSRR